jgi:hypothetical protein
MKEFNIGNVCLQYRKLKSGLHIFEIRFSYMLQLVIGGVPFIQFYKRKL